MLGRAASVGIWALLAANADAAIEIHALTEVIEGHQVGGVTVDMVGDLYVADFGETVWKITMEGERRVFATGLAVFTLGSVAAALAPSVDALNVARAVQGLGGAILAPTTLTVLVTTFTEQKANSSPLNGATNVTLNNLRVGGRLVQYSSQFPLAPSGIGTLTSTYTDANGQTQNVKAGALTSGDTWVGAWTGDQTKNNSSDLTLITRNTGVGLMGEQYTTGSGDGKLSYIQFPLSSLTRAPSQATLHLTYVGHRYTSVPSTDTDQLMVQPVSDATCTGGGTSCPVNTMTWQNRPSFTATNSSVARSATFALGSTVIPEGGGNHQNNPIDGRVITVDVTAFVQNAYAAGQSTILFAVCNAGGANHELRFVSSEGAASLGGLTNANADMMPALTLTP